MARGSAWHAQPVVWVGVLVMLATIAGCLVLLAVALRNPDAPIDTGGGHVSAVPPRHAGPARPSERTAP